MRVIAGSARRLILKTIDGLETRPTTDRLKETLFNIINSRLYGCDFLDLFSGSGAIGIEALSRGAREAVFIENNRQAVECIKINLHNTHLEEKAYVINSDVIAGINSLKKGSRVFDIIFMDPPYNKNLEKDVLEQLKSSLIISNDTSIIIEADINADYSYVSDMGFEIIKEKKYRTNKHVFIQRKK